MAIAQLIDLETQLERDAAASASGGHGELAARDAGIGSRLAAARKATPVELAARAARDDRLLWSLLVEWLAAVGGPSSPGRRAEGPLRVAGRIGLALGVVFGGGAAAATLAYDGREPVNVLWFVGVLVAPQALMLLVLLAVARRAGGGVLAPLLRGIARWRWLGRQHGELADAAGAAAARLAPHADVERWHVFTMTQAVAVAANVAALVVLLAQVAFTDLAFGWSSTMFPRATVLHGLVAAIAAPWAWCLPDAAPDLALLEQTQWVRMPATYVGGATLAEAAAASRRWWSFLAVALAFWGLLPRLLAWSFGRRRAARAVRATVRRDPRCLLTLARLFPAPGWTGPAPSAVGSPADERLAAAPVAPAPLRRSDGDRGWLLAWGRLAAHLPELARRFGPVLGARAVGGDDLAVDDAACRELAGAGAQRVLLLCAAGVQPNKELLELLAALRRLLGARALLEVGLVDDADPALPPAPMAATNARAWAQTLLRRGDPALRLVRLEGVA